MKKIISIVVAVIIIILVLTLGSSKDNSVIKIGFVGPLSGGAAAYGDQYKAGVAFAYEELFKDGARDGKKFQIIYEDGACDGTKAVAAAQKLINVDKVDAILGGFCSSETLAMIDTINKGKIPVITSGPDPVITQKSKYIFQNWPVDSYGGQMEADLVKRFNHKKVAVISANTPYAIGISNEFIKNYGEVILNEQINEDELDYRSTILKIKESGVDAVVVNTQTPKTLILFAKQLRDLGVTAQIYDAYGNGKDVLETPALQGMRIVDAPAVNGDPNDLQVKFKDKYGISPSVPFLVALGYDALNILSESFIKEGRNTDDVIKYLENRTFNGNIGEYKFVNHQITGLKLPFRQVVDGKMVDIK